MAEIGLFIVLALVLAAEFVNGWTDAPNSIATSVSTQALKPLQAVWLAAIFNLLGTLSGTKVAETIGTGFIKPEAINLTTVGSAMFSVILWGVINARFGIPVSKSHALVAALTGAGFATGGLETLIWSGWEKVLLGLFFSSFLGYFVGLGFMIAIYWLFRKTSLGKVRSVFSVLQILSAAFMSFSHGSNDGQKLMGAFTLVLLLKGIIPAFVVPFWVMLLCASMISLGTLIGGWKIMKTVGFKITKLDTSQGFAAEMGAASTIELASRLGIPLSTTHTINFAIMGVGSTRRLSAVRWGITLEILAAWIITFPFAAIVAYLANRLLLLIM
jgi:PiT family inorganic phosphate transporter